MADREKTEKRIEEETDERTARRGRGKPDERTDEPEGPSHLGEAERAFEERGEEDRPRPNKRD